MKSNIPINEFYKYVLSGCLKTFSIKLEQYGDSFKIFRLSSLIDQIYIKLHRIRFIEDNSDKVKIEDESIKDSLGSVINYSIITLFDKKNIDYKDQYNKQFEIAYNLIKDKNNDYDNVWMNMKNSSFTDIMLVKIYRMHHAIDNDIINKNIIVKDCLLDIINYSVFYLYKINLNEN